LALDYDGRAFILPAALRPYRKLSGVYRLGNSGIFPGVRISVFLRIAPKKTARFSGQLPIRPAGDRSIRKKREEIDLPPIRAFLPFILFPYLLNALSTGKVAQTNLENLSFPIISYAGINGPGLITSSPNRLKQAQEQQ